MLFRIALAVAILAGIGVTVLNLVQVKEKVTTIMGERDTFHKERDDERNAHAKTKAELAKTKTELDKTQKDLASTRTERDTAVADADRQRKESGRLKDQLDKTTGERNEAQRELAAWKVLGYDPDQVKGLIASYRQSQKDVAELTNELSSVNRELVRTQNRLRIYEDPNYEVREPDVVAKVIGVDPKFDFVVLDVGHDKGMLENGEMLVSRDGKLVAKVKVRAVERDRSIANVLPGWKLTDVYEGDVAVPKLIKL